MAGKRGFLIDLDGTLYRGGQRVEYADQFIGRLKERQIPHLFLTNNSSRTPADVAMHLNRLGIPATPGEVYTTALAAARYIAAKKPGARVFVVGEAGLREAVVEAGLHMTDEAPDYVLQGIDRSFSYETLNEAVRHIRSGAEYVLTNPDTLLPTDDGFLPGAGSLAASIERAGGKSPIVIGKPSPIMMNDAIAMLGLSADSVYVVGDNVHTDIRAGQAAVCKTVLVLTGITTRTNLSQQLAQAAVKPDYIYDDLSQLLEQLVEA